MRSLRVLGLAVLLCALVGSADASFINHSTREIAKLVLTELEQAPAKPAAKP